MYADTPMDESVSQMLYPDIKNKIEGLSDVQAVNQILNWVQTAFQYEYDDKVWGHDRAFLQKRRYIILIVIVRIELFFLLV